PAACHYIPSAHHHTIPSIEDVLHTRTAVPPDAAPRVRRAPRRAARGRRLRRARHAPCPHPHPRVLAVRGPRGGADELARPVRHARCAVPQARRAALCGAFFACAGRRRARAPWAPRVGGGGGATG
ncbi:hypothetical protein HYPSUDRAFT_218188, partial [Hypholoma sublateritium FD-334 SS-4]